MNVLVCGARGFVGRAVGAQLRARGHRVIDGVSSAAGQDAIVVDYGRDLDAATWRPRLQGVDAVVNAVGALRDRRHRPLSALHDAAPRALFDACADAGVRRVVQVSALGVAASSTRYASTKRAADEHLDALARAGRVDAAIVRPSIVFGRGGASSALFIALSRLPVLVLPGPMRRARVQPVAVDELAQVIATLVEAPQPVPAAGAAGLVEAVGPEPLGLADFVASLRAQAGHSPALLIGLPDLLTRLSARLGDAVPASPWSSEALALLDVDNVADPAPFAALLGHPATRFDALLRHAGA